MAVFSCDGDNEDIELETDTGKLGLAGLTLPFTFAQKGILSLYSLTICNTRQLPDNLSEHR